MEVNKRLNNNRCIICSNKKNKSKSKTCGEHICLRLYFEGVHKARTPLDKTLILYLINNNQKFKDNLLEQKKETLMISIRRLKRKHNETYNNNIIKIQELINGE